MNTNRFNNSVRVGLPLLLVILAGAAGCSSSSNSDRNPYASSDDDLGIPRSRPVLTADAQGRGYEQRQVVYEEPATTSRTERTEARSTGMNTVTMAFPTGERSSSSLLVERTAPSEIVVGAPFHYTMKVTNLTNLNLNNVFVAETSDNGLEVTSANMQPNEGTPWQNQWSNRGQNAQGFNRDNDNPKMNDQANRTGRTWDVGSLAPHETKTIEVDARANEGGAINTCVFAGFNPEVCITMNAVAPSLQVRIQAPKEALVCEDIPLKFTVTNTGTGTARDVRLQIPMTSGLRSVAGADSGSMSLGDIQAGQTKEVTINARADRTGQFTTNANASGGMGLSAESDSATFNVVQPQLTINFEAPETQYLGRDIGSRVSVTNTSNVVARDVRVNANLSGNVHLANEAGAPAGNSWNIGDLTPGETKSTQLFFSMREPGTVSGTFTADARCAEQAKSAQFSAKIVGIPALLLEVVDEVDPVPIGQATSYTIRVTNQGSSPATNIKITAMIPEEFDFISARGAGETQEMQGAGANRRFEFRPLGTLAPKATAEWTIRVKANGPGDVRFGTSLTADQLDSPVEETESTHLYR